MTTTVDMPSELTIYTAADTLRKINDAYRQQRELTLDLARTHEIDTAGLQILMALKQQAERDQRQVFYVNHSAPVVKFLDFFNVSALFRDPVVIASGD